MNNPKTTTAQRLLAVVLSLFLLVVCVSCGEKVDAEGLWANATYLSDTTLGEGSKTIAVEVKVEEQSVTFTVKTDAETVGAALLENNLIAGDEGEYGLYVKVVNGITADYDVDQSYWAFYLNGEYATSGIDTTAITDGAHYELVYTK